MPKFYYKKEKSILDYKIYIVNPNGKILHTFDEEISLVHHFNNDGCEIGNDDCEIDVGKYNSYIKEYTDTYNIDELQECINGKVWIKTGRNRDV